VLDDDGKGWLRYALNESRGAFRDLALISLFINILVLSIPVFVLQVYDRVVFQSGMTTLQGLVIGMGIVIGFDFILRQARSRVFQGVALRVDAAVGRALYNKVISLPLRMLESRPTTFWQSVFRDVDAIRNAVSGPSAALILDLPFAILFFIVIMVIAPPVAWVLLVFVPLFMILAWRSGKVMRRAASDERELAMSREGLLSELISGRATVKSLALGEAVAPRWEDCHARAIEIAQQRGEAGDGYHNLGYIMTMSTTVIVTTVGALAILEQQMTIGSLIAANMLSARLVGPMSQLVSQWRMFMQFRESAKRLDEVFAMTSERTEIGIELPRPKGAIYLEKLVFQYKAEGQPVIDGIDGSAGRVLLDEADVAQFTQRQLAGWVGYLPQECTLFAGSIRENIAIAYPDSEDVDVIAAAELAKAHQYIVDLPDGYDTQLTEGGHGLSTGQRQRIAVARAFMNLPPVLLLDEPSSNLDREAEQGLAETLREYARENTVMVVTHSPVLLAMCNSILVLEKGRVVMAGPAGQVLAKLQPGPKPVPMQEGKPA
jgi:ATP-binding cassette subfamily C protein LapB